MNTKRMFGIYQTWLNGDGIDFAKEMIQKHEAYNLASLAYQHLRQETAHMFVLAIISELIEN
ncbi:MAG: hypothetical protein PHN56_03995 [Candidatus Nanoarchaeia archaeon]|nr:hypothetical protein [Candidatus Nanoarchaeia archaeon]